MREYKAAFREVSEIRSTPKDYLLFALSFFERLIQALLVVASLFLLSVIPRLSQTFCIPSDKEDVWATLKGMIIVVLLLFFLPHFTFNPFAPNYIEKVCLSVYLYNEPTIPLSQYYFSNGISLVIIPIYYMKKGQISLQPLFTVNTTNLKTILKYLLLGVLGLIFLVFGIVVIHLIARTVVSAGAVAKDVQNPQMIGIDFPSKMYVALVGPFIEEICFRGWVFLSLKKHFKTYISIIFSALFFLSSPHHMASYAGVVAAFGTGILYAFLVHKSNSLWPSFLLHVVWNSLLLTVILA